MQFGIIAESDYICTSVPVNKEAASGCSDGGIGRHEGLKIPWAVMSVRVRFPFRVLKNACQSIKTDKHFVYLVCGRMEDWNLSRKMSRS